MPLSCPPFKVFGHVKKNEKNLIQHNRNCTPLDKFEVGKSNIQHVAWLDQPPCPVAAMKQCSTVKKEFENHFSFDNGIGKVTNVSLSLSILYLWS